MDDSNYDSQFVPVNKKAKSMTKSNDVKISKPEIKGALSNGRNGNYSKYVNALRYLKYDIKNVYFNLKEYLSDTKVPDYVRPKRFNNMLKYVIEKKQKGEPFNAKIFCTIGVLMCFMEPSFKNKPWEVKVVNFMGTIYIIMEDSHKSDLKANKSSNNNNTEFGFIFEDFVLSSDPNEFSIPRKESSFEKDELYVLFEITIDDLPIFYGAEIDGVISSEIINKTEDTASALKKVQLVELKTQFYKSRENYSTGYDFKWWAKSFLKGIEIIHNGVRTEEGIVNKIQQIKTADLEKDASKSRRWNQKDCLNSLKNILNRIKTVADKKSNTAFRYKYDSSNNNYTSNNCEMFLPKEYVEFINNLVVQGGSKSHALKNFRL